MGAAANSTVQLVLVIAVLLVILAVLGDFKFFALRSLFRDMMPIEGFQGEIKGSETVEGAPEPLEGGAAFSETTEKLLTSDRLIPMGEKEAVDHWGKLTSERCFRADVGEPLKRTRNYLQRTNNYVRSHPDSCSAPRHEFIGTFYRPHEGVGATPLAGTHFPPSTQCASGGM